jgi:hypothetical protein
MKHLDFALEQIRKQTLWNFKLHRLPTLQIDLNTDLVGPCNVCHLSLRCISLPLFFTNAHYGTWPLLQVIITLTFPHSGILSIFWFAVRFGDPGPHEKRVYDSFIGNEILVPILGYGIEVVLSCFAFRSKLAIAVAWFGLFDSFEDSQIIQSLLILLLILLFVILG